MEQLVKVVAALESYVGDLQPELVSGDDASRLVELFTKGSRLCTAGRALAAKRAAEANAWKAGGYRSAEDWLAAKTKTSRAAAAEALQTAEQIENLPATREALVSGEVSVEQAAAIAAAATVDPTAEDLMLREAERASLGGLQKTSRALVAAASKNQAADRERIHRSRYFKNWTSRDGAVEGHFRLTPDAGAVLLAAIDAEKQEVFAQAKADGRYESDPAYAADALVNLARNTLDDAAAASPPTEPNPAPAAHSAAVQLDIGRADAPGDATGDPSGSRTDAGSSDPGTSISNADSSDTSGSDARSSNAGGSDTGSFDTAAYEADEAGPPDEVEAVDDQELADSIDDDPADEPPPAEPGQPKRRRGRTPPNVVHIRVDLDALLRGHTEAGEVCEAVGIGPVSVETAQHALCDAIVRLLNVKDGQVIDICHAGRTIPTKLAVALEERDRICCVPDCDAARHLQNHHLHPVEFLGPTSLANLARVCPRHHEQITHQGAQLTGTPGNWTWHPPGTNVPYPVAAPPGNARDRAAPPRADAGPTLILDLQ
jgi:hypothetical protein